MRCFPGSVQCGAADKNRPAGRCAIGRRDGLAGIGIEGPPVEVGSG